MEDELEICSKCGKPVLSGEPRNGMTGNHWDCDPARDARKDMREAVNNLTSAADRTEALLRKLKRKL